MNLGALVRLSRPFTLLAPAFARAPGTLRNVLTTAVGATAGGLAFAGGLVG